MLLAEVGDVQQFLSRLLRRETYLPGNTAAISTIIDKELLIKLTGGFHLKTLNHHFISRNQLTLMIHLMIYIAIIILMVSQFQLGFDDEQSAIIVSSLIDWMAARN